MESQVLYHAGLTVPTCVEQGYTTYTCATCGDSYVSDYVNATGHTESEWIVDQEAAICVKGHTHTECTVCEETLKEEDIPALEQPQDSSSSEKPESEVPDSSVDSSKPSTPNNPSQNSSSNQDNAGGGCFG